MTIAETWKPSERCASWCAASQYNLMIGETVYIAISNIVACALLYAINRWPGMLGHDHSDKFTRFGIWYLILTNITFAVYIIARQRYI